MCGVASAYLFNGFPCELGLAVILSGWMIAALLGFLVIVVVCDCAKKEVPAPAQRVVIYNVDPLWTIVANAWWVVADMADQHISWHLLTSCQRPGSMVGEHGRSLRATPDANITQFIWRAIVRPATISRFTNVFPESVGRRDVRAIAGVIVKRSVGLRNDLLVLNAAVLALELDSRPESHWLSPSSSASAMVLG